MDDDDCSRQQEQQQQSQQSQQQPAGPPAPSCFSRRKAAIVAQLSLPEEAYSDRSPKGSVDAGIRDLIDDINGRDGFVTTSSCAGRLSVFLDARRGCAKRPAAGTWLFVSHEPVAPPAALAALAALLHNMHAEPAPAPAPAPAAGRLIHFKFEPMILHVLTASPRHAHQLVCSGLAAGFRESGAVNLVPASAAHDAFSVATPMVAIRSTGLALESLIGMETDGIRRCTVSEDYLLALVTIANERFVENARRVERFRKAWRDATSSPAGAGNKKGRKAADGGDWEDPVVRRDRKRLEGLKRAEDVRRLKEKDMARQGTGESDAAEVLEGGLQVQ